MAESREEVDASCLMQSDNIEAQLEELNVDGFEEARSIMAPNIDRGSGNILLHKCSNCDEMKAELEKMIDLIKNQTMKVMKDLETQTTQIEYMTSSCKFTSAMGMNSKYWPKIQDMIKEHYMIYQFFPIKSEEHLFIMDQAIRKGKKQQHYVKTIKTLLQSNEDQILEPVFDPQFIVDYDVDVVEGRKRLNYFSRFYSTFKEAFSSLFPIETERELQNLITKIRIKQNLELAQLL